MATANYEQRLYPNELRSLSDNDIGNYLNCINLTAYKDDESPFTVSMYTTKEGTNTFSRFVATTPSASTTYPCQTIFARYSTYGNSTTSVADEAFVQEGHNFVLTMNNEMTIMLEAPSGFSTIGKSYIGVEVYARNYTSQTDYSIMWAFSAKCLPHRPNIYINASTSYPKMNFCYDSSKKPTLSAINFAVS